MAKIEDFKAEDIMSEKLPHAEPGDTVSDAIGLMRKHEMEEIPVVQDSQVVGVLSDTVFIDRRNLSFSTKLKHVIHRGPSVDEDDSLVEVSEMLLSSDYRGVPVTSKSGDYIGFLTRKNVTETIPKLDELKKTIVKEFMTPSPATIKTHENIGKARAMMKRYDVRVLPVVNKYGILRGMVGIQDILEEVARPMTRQEKGVRSGERDSPYQDIEVQSIMSEPPITINPNSKIHKAAEKMNEHDISTLVAIQEDEIKGILTQYDLIEMITSFREADQVYVQISGLEEGPEIYDQMYDLIQSYLKKINKVLKPLVLNVHVVSHQKEGNQRKYSVRLRLSTDHGMLYAKEFDWNMMKALDMALDTLKKRIFQEKEKRVKKRKHPKYQKLISENE
ncbi:MAG: CBS domain-containing protein [Candidatus Thermoplasmatota archaeon]|nr:CBS domain-containing protein [Candidatus Thermoplasmatota archaeon]MBS3790081.1 CBS domain-containing protein [Candidatus Thermoplasmatota archaeon]